MLKWLQANGVIVLSVLASAWVVYALLRAILASRRGHRPSAVEEFERTEKVKQQIRRRIAERKANLPATGTSAKEARKTVPPTGPA